MIVTLKSKLFGKSEKKKKKEERRKKKELIDAYKNISIGAGLVGGMSGIGSIVGDRILKAGEKLSDEQFASNVGGFNKKALKKANKISAITAATTLPISALAAYKKYKLTKELNGNKD